MLFNTLWISNQITEDIHPAINQRYGKSRFPFFWDKLRKLQGSVEFHVAEYRMVYVYSNANTSLSNQKKSWLAKPRSAKYQYLSDIHKCYRCAFPTHNKGIARPQQTTDM